MNVSIYYLNNLSSVFTVDETIVSIWFWEKPRWRWHSQIKYEYSVLFNKEEKTIDKNKEFPFESHSSFVNIHYTHAYHRHFLPILILYKFKYYVAWRCLLARDYICHNEIDISIKQKY